MLSFSFSKLVNLQMQSVTLTYSASTLNGHFVKNVG